MRQKMKELFEKFLERVKESVEKGKGVSERVIEKVEKPTR